MKHLAFFPRLLPLFLTLMFLPACTQAPHTQALLQNATINGQPASFMVDTGGSLTTLNSSAARRIGFTFTPPAAPPKNSHNAGQTPVGLSEPIRFSLGSQSITAQFPVISDAFTQDGLIGWPQIRDNLLFFDSARSTITAADSLPPQTATWLQLKIHRFDVLLLEIPLPNGATGNLLIDTGAPNGVSLPPGQWKQWRAAHPNAPLKDTYFHGPSVGKGHRPEAWADSVTLGNLTLTDLPVLPATPFEASWIPNYAGSLGIYALSRMELVVDAKNNRAFLHPLPPPGPYYSTFNRPGILPPATEENWTVAGNLQIHGDQLFLFAAHLKWHNNDHPGALADLDRAIAQDPNNVDAYLARAGDRAAGNDFAGAVTDYTRALELEPSLTYIYRSRAIASQCLGNFPAAIADCDHIIQTDSASFFSLQLARESLLRRLGKPSANFPQTIASWPNGWPKTVGQYLAGQLSQQDLLKAADKKPAQVCIAHYYLGMTALLANNPPAARANFQQALDTKAQDTIEFNFTSAELARLPTPKSP